jgi:Ca2+-binding EF-hand superfamily protein
MQVFDRNSDGYISKLELHKTMIDLGIPLSREDLDVMMQEADINKDGRIDYSGEHFCLRWQRSQIADVLTMMTTHLNAYCFLLTYFYVLLV